MKRLENLFDGNSRFFISPIIQPSTLNQSILVLILLCFSSSSLNLLSRSTLVLISNLVKASSPDRLDSPSSSSFPAQKINAIFAVWSILTSSNAILKQWIGIPASASLSSLVIERVEQSGSGDPEADSNSKSATQLVTLSDEDKTLGLLLSASRLQATNVNWTFESVRATHGVGG